MSDTRKVLVVTDNRTIIKKIKIGTPIRNVTQGGQTTALIDDLDTGVKAGGDVLIYRPSTDTYHSAQIASGTNINVTYDSDTKNLTVATALDSLTGSIIPDSNEVYDLGSSSKKFRDLYLSGSTINLGTLRLEDSGGSFIVKDSDGRPVLTEVSLVTTNTNILSYDSATGIFNFNDSDVARTDIDETFHKNLTVASGLTADSATLGGINLSGNDLTTTGKLYFSNVFSNVGDLPDASTYHGMFAHVHGTGSAYFAHAGNWVKLLDSDGYILSAGTGLNYDSANRQFSLANTGVTAASYGSSTTVPQISINAQGQIDSARNITIAGVTGVDFDSATGTITIQTTGGDFSDVITLDPYSTSNLVEGSNLYYTTARADSAFDVRLATKSTDNLSEGSNLYYTTARADSDAKNAISVTDAGGDGSLTYNSANGVITYTGPSAAEIRAHFQAGTGVTYDSASGTLSIGQGVATTDNVTFNNLVVSGNLTVSGTETTVNTETINLADNEIVLNSNFDSGTPTENGGISIRRGDFANKTLLWNETTDKWTVGSETFEAGTFEGNLTGDVTGQVSSLGNHSTTNLSEGDNLYYTTARADSAFDVRLATKSTTDVSEGTNLYYTTARADSDAKNAISVTDAGGDGSMSYNAGTGVITYTGPSASEVRAHFTADKGLTVTNGEFNIDSANVRGMFVGGTGITYTSGTGTFDITNTGVTAGTYGSASLVPVVTVNAQGQIDSIGTVSVAGVSSIDFDSATGNFTINTADGGTFVETITLDPYTTSNLIEGSNLYYTTARADSAFDVRLATKTTDNLSQGSTNKYYDSATTETTARYAISVTDAGGDGSISYNVGTGAITYTGPSATEVRAHLVAGTGITYDSANGVIASAYQAVDTTDSVTFSGLYVSGNTVLGGNLTVTGTTTTVNTETINLADNIILLNSNHTGSATQSAGIEVERGSDSNTSLLWDEAADRWSIGSNNFAAGTFIGNLTGQASDISNHTTDDLTQGSTNLYYDSATTQTNARYAISVTDAGGDGSLAYNVGTGVITYTGPGAAEVRSHFQDGTGVTYDSASGQISIGQDVSTTSDVTFGKVTQDSAVSKGIRFIPQTSAFSQTAGSLHFDSAYDKGLTVRLNTPENANPDVNLNIGQETFLYAKNETGAAISNGEAVYISGTETGDGHPLITKARANTSTTGKSFGLATMDIPDGAHGWVTRYGLVRDVNTGGMTEGSVLFLSPDSAGVVTETPVTVDTGFPQHIGRVIVADASNGVILVDGATEHFDDLRVENKLKTTQLVADSASLLNVQFDNTTFSGHQPYSEGLLFYDNEHKTLNYYNDINGTSINPIEIGTQEHQRVFNNSGSVIKKGSVLYFNGNYTSGAQDVPTVALADASSSSAYNSQGLAAHDIANNSYGMLLLQGQLTEVNTANLNADNQFFVSATTPGGKTNTPPTYPNFPMCMGWVVVSGDSSSGIMMVNRENHSVNSFRVRTSAHIGTDLQVDGNLTILGSQTTVGQANVTQGSPIYRLNEGDAIGEAGTTFTGTGLDDAFFAGHFTGTSAQSYYVRIDGVGTGAGGVDTFAVALGNDSTFTSPILTKVNITTNDQLIHSTDNISVNFGATTGHDSGDRWQGTASPINVDTGFFTNRNTGTSGVGYTHMGFFFDVSDEKWKLIDEYDSTPTGTIVVTDSSLGIMVAAGFEGPLTGAVTGNASTATALAAGRDFSLTGDITASAVSFDGTGAVQLTTAYNPGSIVNADINASAAIADTKLATISTAGKVNNSATTATSNNTGSAIVTRDASGNFSAGTVTLTDLHVGNLHVDSATITSLAQGVSINNVVEDTTPQLGGNLDLNSNDITGTGDIDVTGTVTADDLFVGNLHVDSADIISLARGSLSVSGDLAYDSSTGQFSFSETYSTAAELMTALQTIDSDVGGLNASTLDGQEGTHYRINVYNSSGTLLN